jgi:ABC-type branched-subunit amino acid transport system substrate-binding protein
MKVHFSIKAFPWLILWGGLFFAGCAGMPSVEAPSPVSAEAESDYRAGVEFQGEGRYDDALESFSRALETDPGGRTAPAAMNRIAEIHHVKGEDRAALEVLEKLEGRFPDYPGTADARLLKVEVLVSLEKETLALKQGISWAEANRDHGAYPKMCVLLGDLSLQAGDRAAAFRWWLEAYERSDGDAALRAGAEERLNDVLETSDPEDLEPVAEVSGGTEFAPAVYLRMAQGYLSKGEMGKSQEAATALIRSSEDDEWIERGEKILEAVRRESSVQKNVIGCILPQSGPFAVYGREVLRGIHLGLAIEAEYSDPGIELVLEDSGSGPEKAGDGLVRLVEEEKVIGVIGPLSSKVAGTIAEQAQGLGVPLITLTQKEGITRLGEQVFRNFIFPSREVKRVLDGAMGGLGMRRFAALYPENSYGRAMVDLFREGVFERGGELIAVAGYEPGTTDFSASIKELTGLDPSHTEDREEREGQPDRPQPLVDFEAIFIPDSYETVAMLAPQILYYDITSLWLLGTSAWQSPRLLEQASEYIQRSMFPTGFFEASTRPGVDSFVQTYRAWYGSDPGILAATGYDTIKFLLRILRGQKIRNRIDLRLAMKDSTSFAGVTGDISFDETGEVEKDPFLLTVRGGKFIEF